MSTRVPKQQTVMRRAPRQARSRAMVESILEAGARVLSHEGWSGFTTNRVAEIAGVGIGSLYQYFPDKLSLIHGIRQRHLDYCLMAVRQVREEARDVTQFVTRLVDALIAVHSLHPGLHQVLLDEAPSSDTHRDPASEFEREYLGLYEDAARFVRGSYDETARVTALIISDAIDGVIHNAARRGMLGDLQVRNALIRLVSDYLATESEPKTDISPPSRSCGGRRPGGCCDR